MSLQLDTNVFNPSDGQKARLRIDGPSGYAARIVLCEAQGLPIRSLWQGRLGPNPLEIEWDGKDDSGLIVPNEAYYPKALAWKGWDTVHFDPPWRSGGEPFTVTKADVNLDKGTISYRVPQDSRMYIRAGVKKGLMVRSILHGEVRARGSVIEHWNGRDPDNLVSVRDLEAWSLVISGFALPKPSIIAYGNGSQKYRRYFQDRFGSAPAEYPLSGPDFHEHLIREGRKTSPHFTYPLSRDYVPELIVAFPNAPDSAGHPLLRGDQRLQVDIHPEDRLFFRDQQFELCFFVDGQFVAEDEIGYMPYNWVWNSSQAGPGEHVVTVNLSSFRDQIATRSLKVRVAR